MGRGSTLFSGQILHDPVRLYFECGHAEGCPHRVGIRPADIAIDWKSVNRVLFVKVADGAAIVVVE